MNEKIEKQKKLNQDVYEMCLEKKPLVMIKELIEKGADPSLAVGQYSYNGLHAACTHEEPDMELIKYLIEERKLSLILRTGLSFNCLHIACAQEKPHRPLIEYLVKEKKMNPNRQTSQEEDCLLLVLSQKNPHTGLIKFFLDYKKDLTYKPYKQGLIQKMLNTGDAIVALRSLLLGVDPHMLDPNQINSEPLSCLMSELKKHGISSQNFLKILKQEMLSILAFNHTRSCLSKSDKARLETTILCLKKKSVKNKSYNIPKPVQGLFFKLACDYDTDKADASLASLINDEQTANEIFMSTADKLSSLSSQQPESKAGLVSYSPSFCALN